MIFKNNSNNIVLDSNAYCPFCNKALSDSNHFDVCSHTTKYCKVFHDRTVAQLITMFNADMNAGIC